MTSASTFLYIWRSYYWEVSMQKHSRFPQNPVCPSEAVWRLCCSLLLATVEEKKCDGFQKRDTHPTTNFASMSSGCDSLGPEIPQETKNCAWCVVFDLSMNTKQLVNFAFANSPYPYIKIRWGIPPECQKKSLRGMRVPIFSFMTCAYGTGERFY